MGSKLSRTFYEHKEATASPRLPASTALPQNQLEKASRQESYDHEQTGKDTTTAPTSTRDSPVCEPTSAHDTDAMEVEPHPRRSTDSHSASILRGFDQLPGAGQNCLICCAPCDGPEKEPAKELRPCSRCNRAFCVPCLKDMFVNACKDLSRMPPRCCNQIPLHHARPYLTAEEITLFKAKYEEWGTPSPFYCPVARCSTFIPNRMLPQANENGKGKQRVDSGIGTPTRPTVTCPKCEVDICTNCRSLAHANEICSPFNFGVDEQTADLLQKWGYRKCPKCGQGVKRMYGCNHMECRCGAHFCWGCMQGRDNCLGNCDDEDEDDYSDYEPDQEEYDEVQEEDDAPSTISPTANLAHVFPHMLPTGEGTEPPVTAINGTSSSPTTGKLEDTVIETSPTSARVRNLDGGSSRYWEDQDYDFGNEPGDNYADRSWDCYHDFTTAKIGIKDAFVNDASANPVECMKCWATIHPEIMMPKSINTGKSKITTAIAPAGIRTRVYLTRGHQVRHPRRQAMSSLRGNRSMENLGAMIAASPLSSSSASFSSFLPPSFSQEDDASRVLDLYGNTVATAKQPTPGNTDEEMPDWDELFESKSENPLATKSTPFNFACECDRCGILVCHRCKDNLNGTHKDTHKVEKEAENEEDTTQETCDTQEIGGEEENCTHDEAEQADKDVGYAFEVNARETEYERLWTQWVAAR
ncbi:hypothetical protein DPSP01_002910 [Paraphaeosphaeria sporulosa]